MKVEVETLHDEELDYDYVIVTVGDIKVRLTPKQQDAHYENSVSVLTLDTSVYQLRECGHWRIMQYNVCSICNNFPTRHE